MRCAQRSDECAAGIEPDSPAALGQMIDVVKAFELARLRSFRVLDFASTSATARFLAGQPTCLVKIARSLAESLRPEI